MNDPRDLSDILAQVRLGDRLARDEILNRFTRLAWKAARSWRRIGMHDLDDLVQEGMIALDYAARRYDPARGVKFITYATRVVANRLCNLHRAKNNKVPCCPMDDANSVRVAAAPGDDALESVDLTPITPRQRQAIEWHYGLDGSSPLSQRAIARRMGIKPHAVRQLLATALRSLRARMPR